MVQPKFEIQKLQDPHWHMPRLHCHDCCEFFLPLQSEGTLYMGELSFPYTENTLFFLGSGTLHRSVSHTAHHRYVLHITPETLEAFSTAQTDFTKLSHAPIRQLHLIDTEIHHSIQLFQQLLDHGNDGSFGNDIGQSMALLELLLYLSPLFFSSTEEAPKVFPNMAKDLLRVKPILDYIQENLAEPLSLDQISSSFYISKHHLCRIFKSATGYTVIEYIVNCRMAKARQLLQEGFSVQRAGELAGFSDNSHFIRTFGKCNGISPGKYAKHCQQANERSPYA